jgi:hypothetical protein
MHKGTVIKINANQVCNMVDLMYATTSINFLNSAIRYYGCYDCSLERTCQDPQYPHSRVCRSQRLSLRLYHWPNAECEIRSSHSWYE